MTKVAVDHKMKEGALYPYVSLLCYNDVTYQIMESTLIPSLS